MPELIEQMYCSQQIVIPPKFPYLLKKYCKAAIKTQPYDLLRWSFEYFKALAENRPPPVKLRLEYPVFSTEGGLTRGCLKVIANQLAGMTVMPLPVIKAAWGGFCLDKMELKQILCLCEVYTREDAVPFLHFISVAAGLLTKSLTHTMILLCESLTKEPDGGSAAIAVQDFLTMYKYLAKIDASKDVKYIDGYREGQAPKPESIAEEEASAPEEEPSETSSDEYWEDTRDIRRLTVINDKVPFTARLSLKLTKSAVGKIERSPSVEREAQIERENYSRERKGRPSRSEEVDQKLAAISTAMMSTGDATKEAPKEKPVEAIPEKKEGIEIFVYDEDENEIPYEFYGEPKVIEEEDEANEGEKVDQPEHVLDTQEEELKSTEEEPATKVADFVADAREAKQERIEDMERTLDEIAALVDRFKSANYDLGMVAGRQMSTTSGEFIVQHIEKEIMDYIDEQIAVLPDPDLKKKKAKPEEVEMVHELLQTFIDENMDVIVPEIEEVEEEELPIPDIVLVYAVPGIGPVVDADIVREFVDYALDICKVQADLFMPRNIRHFMCPPLEKYEETKYELPAPRVSKEEVATGGIITD
ncbi:unnamed protein product [Chilo suppressalis]|uniref:RIIa domain-containing protein n=1 Tax=Chilo suppressalis TaxID=168631 RepID=A0ABN8B583_CHISP|nr:unnamed protein product [Chilo suppressalis]